MCHAKLWKVYRGLCLAWDLDYHKIDLQIDSKLLVQAIPSPLVNPCFNLDLIQVIQSLLHRQGEVNIHHVFREDNALADLTNLLILILLLLGLGTY